MDIIDLMKKIQIFIESEYLNCTQYNCIIKRIDHLLGKKDFYNIRHRIVRKLELEKTLLLNKIQNLENLKYFEYEAEPIILHYKDLNKNFVINPFFNPNPKALKEHLYQKSLISKQFLNLVNKYNLLDISAFGDLDKINLPRTSPCPCPCGNKLEFIKDEDRAVCAICSTEQSLICNTSSFSDVGRVNMTSKYTYNRKVHFRDCIIQYQGKQKTTIPAEVYTLIETRLKSMKTPEGEDILVPSTIKCEKYKNVTRVIILNILKELGLKKFYDDIVLIHKTLTDQPADNIESLENILLQDFDKLTETYDESVKPPKRKNFINAQFVLYQLLRRHEHFCSEMEFLTLKNSERKKFHHNICKELFQKLQWKYSYSI